MTSTTLRITTETTDAPGRPWSVEYPNIESIDTDLLKTVATKALIETIDYVKAAQK